MLKTPQVDISAREGIRFQTDSPEMPDLIRLFAAIPGLLWKAVAARRFPRLAGVFFFALLCAGPGSGQKAPDPGWNDPGFSAQVDSVVAVIEQQADDKILIAGPFTTVSGLARPAMAPAESGRFG
jgi:hypothetical protein